jgi:peptidoglycan-associated lipoprotein
MVQFRKTCMQLASIAVLALTLSHCTDSPSTEEPIIDDSAVIPAEPGEEVSAPEPAMGTVVYFAYDQSSITAEGEAVLAELANQLKASGSSVQIEGHCDARGSIEYNAALGDRRAHAVKEAFMSLGVDAAKISTISYGKERLAVNGTSEEDHAKNRRAEFNIQ